MSRPSQLPARSKVLVYITERTGWIGGGEVGVVGGGGGGGGVGGGGGGDW